MDQAIIKQEALALITKLLERDDISKLNIPSSAKKYYRAKGLKSMPNQHKHFIKMSKDLVNNPGDAMAIKTVGKVI